MLEHAGSLSFEGIRFQVYSHDHLPRHVHCFGHGINLTLDFREDGSLHISQRKKHVSPKNAKASAIKKLLDCANEHAEELLKLWKETHG
jgi:hypothetical protein